MAEYRCPVLRGMVGPRLSTGSWPSAVGDNPIVASVSSGFLMELAAPFSAAGFLDFLSRCPAFPSLGLVRSLLLHTA